ncbi:hypothetical protein [Bradyrhizobium sp. USDA 3364]
MLTVKRLASLLSITVPAASQAVEQLVEHKILNERTGYARNRVFTAPDALSIINRPSAKNRFFPVRTPDGRHARLTIGGAASCGFGPAVGHAVGSDFREAPSDLPWHAIPQMLNDHAGERELR